VKKALIFLYLLVLMFAGVNSLFAGAIDNSTEMTTTYARFIAMSTATDENAAIYNPAGTIFLKDGLYIMVSNLSAFDRYTLETSDAEQALGAENEYKGKTDSWIVPGLTLTYKQDKWALFFSEAIVAGGGTVDYEDGSITSTKAIIGIAININGTYGGTASDFDSELSGSSDYFGFTLGGAYAVNDMISIAIGGRFIMAQGGLELNGRFKDTIVGTEGIYDLSYKNEESAKGWGGVIGLNITPMKGLLIGLKYESEVALEFEIDKADANAKITEVIAGYIANIGGDPVPVESSILANMYDSLGVKGDKRDRNLPATFNVGVSYMVTPELRVAADFGYFFQSQADWDGAEDDYDDAWSLALGFEYTIMPALKASIGLTYLKIGADDKNYGLPEVAYYDQYGIGLGVEYEVMPGLRLELAYAHQFYVTVEDATGDPVEDSQKTSNDRNAVGIAIKYKIL
jgi:long-chain fatty acid transport protein